MICDDRFLESVRGSHLELKLWQSDEKLAGSAKIPLHQFFIAFRDSAMIEHLSFNQLPIISIDTYTNFVSPLSNELFCQGKVLLAIGSDAQIEYLKLMRNLNNLSMPIALNNQETTCNAPSTSHMKRKLTTFIESLTHKLPESENVNQEETSSLSKPQLRKTSDLLESLQKALSQPPKIPATLQQVSVNKTNDSSSSECSILQEKRVKIQITLEHANHLPKVIKKKQNRRKNKCNGCSEFEPSSYATFDSSLDLQQLNEKHLPGNVVKSHEGFVHCTKVIKSVDPQWNQTYDVELPLDILSNSQKRFVVKIWRKCSQESEMKPAPFEDAVIGFTAVDLSVLLTGLPILSGYYSITDFSGRCNGQIKLTFKPSENLVVYQNSSEFLLPSSNKFLNVDVNMSDEGSNLLSRTLKRKFSELDEITQRLKARLFDVTGNDNFDPDEEFERDLNTVVDEDMEDNSVDFDWLNGNVCHLQPSTSRNALESSSTTIPTQRLVSGCSSSRSPDVGIDQLLHKYDLDNCYYYYTEKKVSLPQHGIVVTSTTYFVR